MTDIFAISLIWLISICVSAIIIIYIRTHKRKPLDYTGWTFGIVLWDVLLTILSVATIICYLPK